MDTELKYPIQVLVPENGLCGLVRVITAIHVACIDMGGAFFGVEFTEDELQDFFDTHPHRYFEVKPKGAIGTAVKKLTKAVLESLKKGALKLDVTRANLDDEVCLLNSWVAFSAFEEWCESRSIELGESWFELYENEEAIASAASEAGENYRVMLEGQSDLSDIANITKEFEDKTVDDIFAEISSLRAKQKKADTRSLQRDKPIGSTERNSLLTIIGAMLEQLTAGTANNTTVIVQAVNDHGHKHGLSKRKLEEVFAAAKKRLAAG